VIPCLSLTQPWASLVAFGEKRVETRSWAPARTAIGQALAIHAAKGFPLWARELVDEPPFSAVLGRHGINHHAELPLGAVVAVARLTAVVRTEHANGRLMTEQERVFGDYSPNRWAWVLDDVVALPEPVPAVGKLGIWSWEPPAWVVELVGTGVAA
jgi:hypothetical protein